MITIEKNGSHKMTKEQFINLGFTEADLKEDKIFLDMKTRGVWSHVTSLKGLVVETHFSDLKYVTHTDFYAVRTVSNPKQESYCMSGRISLDGKKRKVYTSSALVNVEGKLIDIECLSLV